MFDSRSKQTTNGNKNEISRSNIKNKIATIQNFMLNSERESLNGLKPHSYIVNFSASSNLDDKAYDKKKIIVDKITLKIKKLKIHK